MKKKIATALIAARKRVVSTKSPRKPRPMLAECWRTVPESVMDAHHQRIYLVVEHVFCDMAKMVGPMPDNVEIITRIKWTHDGIEFYRRWSLSAKSDS